MTTVTTAAYSADGRGVDRHTFYALACDPRRSVVVEACAGAGKTWMLVSRILRALLDGAEPQEILAITFTRKAAGEMRARLDDWLAEFSAARSTEGQRINELRHRGLAMADAQRLAPALAGLQARLLEAGRPVQISTFHAWFSQLLRAAPLRTLDELGIAPDHELIEGVDDLWFDLLRRLHGRIARDDSLRADYADMVRARGRLATAQWLRTAWSRRVEFSLADRAGVLDDSMPGVEAVYPELAGLDVVAEAVFEPVTRRLFADLAAQLAGGKAISQKQAELLGAALAEADAERCLAAIRQAIFTKTGTVRTALAAPALEDAVARLEMIRLAAEQQEAKRLHGRMVRLTRVLLQVYAQLERERGLVDMADLEQSALTLLSDPGISGSLQQRLDARIGHVLIDEFQDTNPIQWHALYGWLSGYAGAGSGPTPSVFIVGDPKQSIYRFRGAEPRVFEQARQFVGQGLGGVVLACDHTRRLDPRVLDSVNQVFEAAVAQGSYAGFRTHTTECVAHDDGPAVFKLPSVERSPKQRSGSGTESAWRDSLTVPKLVAQERLRRAEARVVAQAVHATVAMGTPAQDVMVLCRKRESLRLLSEELRLLDLPYEAPEALALMATPEVSDLVALLAFVVSTGDALSLAQALKSPIFGATDDDLVALATEVKAHGGSWWHALQALVGRSPAIDRAAGLLPGWIEAARRLPPHDLLDRMIAQGDLRARYAAAVPASQRVAALRTIDALLLLALDLDGARYATPAGFVQALRRRTLKAAAAPSSLAVRLLTIHGAKGLEAPVVFLMDTDPERTTESTATVLVDWSPEDPAPRIFAFVASESRYPPALQALVNHLQAARAREEMNSLYVAMTRAERQIVISRTEPFRAGEGPSWWSRLDELATPWTPEEPALDEPSADTLSLRELPQRVRPAELSEAPMAQDAGNAPTEPTAALGKSVHRLLEWLTRATLPKAAKADAARSACAEFGLGGADAARALAIVECILANPQANRFFDPRQLAWAGNEVGVTLDDGQAARIDRLVALDDGGQRQWWILDYKLSHAPHDVPAYREQLDRYAAAVRRLQPGETVRAAFINADGEVLMAA